MFYKAITLIALCTQLHCSSGQVCPIVHADLYDLWKSCQASQANPELLKIVISNLPINARPPAFEPCTYRWIFKLFSELLHNSRRYLRTSYLDNIYHAACAIHIFIAQEIGCVPKEFLCSDKELFALTMIQNFAHKFFEEFHIENDILNMNCREAYAYLKTKGARHIAALDPSSKFFFLTPIIFSVTQDEALLHSALCFLLPRAQDCATETPARKWKRTPSQSHLWSDTLSQKLGASLLSTFANNPALISMPNIADAITTLFMDHPVIKTSSGEGSSEQLCASVLKQLALNWPGTTNSPGEDIRYIALNLIGMACHIIEAQKIDSQSIFSLASINHQGATSIWHYEASAYIHQATILKKNDIPLDATELKILSGEAWGLSAQSLLQHQINLHAKSMKLPHTEMPFLLAITTQPWSQQNKSLLLTIIHNHLTQEQVNLQRPVLPAKLCQNTQHLALMHVEHLTLPKVSSILKRIFAATETVDPAPEKSGAEWLLHFSRTDTSFQEKFNNPERVLPLTNITQYLIQSCHAILLGMLIQKKFQLSNLHEILWTETVSLPNNSLSLEIQYMKALHEQIAQQDSTLHQALSFPSSETTGESLSSFVTAFHTLHVLGLPFVHSGNIFSEAYRVQFKPALNTAFLQDIQNFLKELCPTPPPNPSALPIQEQPENTSLINTSNKTSCEYLPIEKKTEQNTQRTSKAKSKPKQIFAARTPREKALKKKESKSKKSQPLKKLKNTSAKHTPDSIADQSAADTLLSLYTSLLPNHNPETTRHKTDTLELPTHSETTISAPVEQKRSCQKHESGTRKRKHETFSDSTQKETDMPNKMHLLLEASILLSPPEFLEDKILDEKPAAKQLKLTRTRKTT